MDVKLPKLGEGAESGTVVSILVKEGDRIQEGQTLLELENEKAVVPIPAPADGLVAKIRVKEGDKLSVGQIILTLSDDAAATSQPVSKPAKPAVQSTTEPREKQAEEAGEAEEVSDDGPPVSGGSAPAASPSIRKLARDLGIDLARIRGSERGGRIVLADVRAYIQRLQKASATPRSAQPPPASTSAPGSIDFSKWGAISRKPMSNLRKTISRRMTENWSTIPHVTQFDEADITTLMELRKKHAAAYEKKGTRLTLTAFILKAVAATLQKHPLFNSSLDEAAQEIVLKQYCHIGLAVDTEQGLIVPVIRDVDKRSLLELAREVGTLADKARERKVALDDLKGGTFTISNQGGIGGAHFTPIINKPEVAILGLGRSALKAVARDGKIETRLMLPLALSYDHRVIDGGGAARFIVDLAQALEHFNEDEAKM